MDRFITMFRFIVLFLALVNCGEFTPLINVKNQTVKENQPDILVAEFQTSSFEKEKKSWFIQSEIAKVYDERKETDMERVKFITYDINEATSTFIVSDFAVLNNSTQDITLKENVIIINQQGTEITGNLFYWNNKTKSFSSPNRVKVKKPDGSVISGVGFKSNQRLGNIEFESDVEGELSSGEGEDFFEGF